MDVALAEPSASRTADRVAPLVWLPILAIVAGALFQVVSTAVAAHYAKPYDAVAWQRFLQVHDVLLLHAHHTVADWLELVAHNAGVLAAFTVAALLAAGWRPFALPLRRRAGATVCAVLVAFVFVELTRRAVELMTLFPPPLTGMFRGDDGPPSHYALALMLPHGPLEFGALFLPLVAAARSRGRGDTGLVLRVLPVSLALLVAAGAVETWVSSWLFTALVNQRFGA